MSIQLQDRYFFKKVFYPECFALKLSFFVVVPLNLIGLSFFLIDECLGVREAQKRHLDVVLLQSGKYKFCSNLEKPAFQHAHSPINNLAK